MDDQENVVVEEPQAPEQIESTPDVQPDEQVGDVEVNKGEENRIRELSHLNKVKEQEIKSLQDRINELTTQQEPSFQFPEYNPNEPLVKPGEDTLDANELNKRISDREHRLLRTAEARAELRTRQIDAENRIKSETEQVMQTYAQLNPSSKEFDQELSETVTEALEAHIRVNPYNAKVKQFAEKLMKPYRKAIDKEVGQATEKIARQVSEAALRPTSVRKQEKTAAEKTIAELEAELGIVNS